MPSALLLRSLLHPDILFTFVAIARLIVELACKDRFNYAALQLGSILVARKLKQEMHDCRLILDALCSLELAIKLFEPLLLLLQGTSLRLRFLLDFTRLEGKMSYSF